MNSKVPDTVAGRVRYYFTPWWRTVWFVGSVVWLIVATVIFNVNHYEPGWLGPASATPILAFVVVMFIPHKMPQPRQRRD